MSGAQTMLFIGDLRGRLTLLHLGAAEYFKTLADAAGNQISGGAIYDALIAQCALKARAEFIFTWNPKDFLRLGPVVAQRVRTPDSIVKD